MRCFAGVFTVEVGGEESENGALRVGNFARQRGLQGSSLFSGMGWGRVGFCKTVGSAKWVFPIYRNEMGRAGFCRAAGLPYSLV